MDFFEVMDYVGFDLDRAVEIAKEAREVMDRVGLEDVQSKPLRESCGGLCGACRRRCHEHDVVRGILIIVQ